MRIVRLTTAVFIAAGLIGGIGVVRSTGGHDAEAGPMVSLVDARAAGSGPTEWETYRDRHGRFTFSYPAAWKWVSASEDGTGVFIYGYDMSAVPAGAEELWRPGHAKIELFIGEPSMFQPLHAAERIRVDGVRAHRVLYEHGGDNESFSEDEIASFRASNVAFFGATAFKRDGDAYMLTMYSGGTGNDAEIFERAVRSFRFAG